ncbi:MAG: M14 family metallopeptidase [Anaerolineales bacterium]
MNSNQQSTFIQYARQLAALSVIPAMLLLLIMPAGDANAGELTPEPPGKHQEPGSQYATSAKTRLIGYSVEQRPLVVYQFGDGDTKRMIVAGIHGGYEWNTIALANKLIAFLEKNPGVVPEHLTLYILPALNPDGEAASHGYEGRANANGVDLNRNFPSDWQAAWETAGCWDYLPIGGGPYPLSESEARALAKFLLQEHVEALISYHSAALGIFPGGFPPDPGSLSLAEAISRVTDYPYPPLNTGCEYTGMLADFASDNGIHAVDVELTTHDSLDYETNLRVLLTFLSWRP